MPQTINTNISSLNAQRTLDASGAQLSRALQRLRRTLDDDLLVRTADGYREISFGELGTHVAQLAHGAAEIVGVRGQRGGVEPATGGDQFGRGAFRQCLHGAFICIERHAGIIYMQDQHLCTLRKS